MASTACPVCSTEVAAGDEFCVHCGSSVVQLTAPPAGGPPLAAILQFEPGQGFAGRFTIIEKIGVGGMGVVYKAIDTALDCEVALKLIRPDRAQDPVFRDRFRREVRITRQITHPGICRVHDIGECLGVLYLSMEWVEGETLRQLLKQAEALNERRALEIAARICRALRVAHERGVVHRDLKPANIMIDAKGSVRVLDFGLAVEFDSSRQASAAEIVGTPAYMAPEQRAGARVDARCDLYALGLILREMLTAERPQPDVVPPPELPASIHPQIVPVLRRLIAEDPARRFADGVEAQKAFDELLEMPEIAHSGSSFSVTPIRKRSRTVLGWGLVAALGLVALTLGLRLTLDRSPGEARIHPDAQVFFDRGVHYLQDDSISTRSLDDAIQMFHRALDRDAESGLIWARLAEAYWYRFEQTGDSGSREEAERAVRQAETFDPQLPEAVYAAGIGLSIEGKYRGARDRLESVVDSRPEFAMAWVNLSRVQAALGEYADARVSIDRAITLRPDDFKIRIFEGLFHERFQEYDESAACFRRATELNPDSFVAWGNLGSSLLYTGKFDEAIPVLERSLEIEENATARSNLGTALYFDGEFARAAQQYRLAADGEPSEPAHLGNLGDALMMEQRTDDARDAYRRAAEVARQRLEKEPLDPQTMMFAAVYCAKAADADCARRHAEDAIELQSDNADMLLMYATVLCTIGDESEGLRQLERAVRLGASRAQIEATPEFERLRRDPRFTRIVAMAS